MDAAVPVIANSASAMECREIKDMMRDLSTGSLKSGRKRNAGYSQRSKTASPEKSCVIPLDYGIMPDSVCLHHCEVLTL